MADGNRFIPSLFDKLTGGTSPSRRSDASETSPAIGGAYRFATAVRLDRFDGRAARAVLLRDLNWLFNTINLEASVDLSDVQHVRTSVLNYGVSDLAGKSSGRRALESRARELRAAVRQFEPRLAGDRLDVEVVQAAERDNAVTFVVRSDVVSSLQPLPVEFKTEVNFETGSASVRD